MCYDISYLTRRQIDYAQRYGKPEDVDEISKRLPPVYHTNGFQHSEVPVLVREDGEIKLTSFEWGLIPFWAKDGETAFKISNQTINARGETIFEKPSFRASAVKKRCLVLIDGFFEYHHHKSKAYPYFIKRKDDLPFTLGGLWDEWNDVENGLVRYTFSIITTNANERMAQIHNNPKVLERGGPRMPFIVPFECEKEWLDNSMDKSDVMSMIKPFPLEELTDHTVRPLRGKHASGNMPVAIEPFQYVELGEQGSLF